MKGSTAAALFALGAVAAAAGTFAYLKKKRELEESLILEYDFTEEDFADASAAAVEAENAEAPAVVIPVKVKEKATETVESAADSIDIPEEVAEQTEDVIE